MWPRISGWTILPTRTTTELTRAPAGIVAILAGLAVIGCSRTESTGSHAGAVGGGDSVASALPPPAAPPSQEALRAAAAQADLRTLRRAAEILGREPSGPNDQVLADGLHKTFLEKYAADIDAASTICRQTVCQVRFTLRQPDHEKRTINRIALDRIGWAPASSFSRVDYIRAHTVDDDGRFLLWREATDAGDPRP